MVAGNRVRKGNPRTSPVCNIILDGGTERFGNVAIFSDSGRLRAEVCANDGW